MKNGVRSVLGGDSAKPFPHDSLILLAVRKYRIL